MNAGCVMLTLPMIIGVFRSVQRHLICTLILRAPPLQSSGTFVLLNFEGRSGT